MLLACVFALADIVLHNPSTQLARFPRASRYHANLVLQPPLGLLGAPLANPHILLPYLSLLNSDELCEGKHNRNSVQKQW